MVDQPPEFEIADVLGNTTIFSGTVGTTPVDVPTVAGGIIQSFSIFSPQTNTLASLLQFSIDGGTIYEPGYVNNSGETVKLKTSPGGGATTQIKVKANQAGVDFIIKMNREITP